MILGQSAGIAASLAAKQHIAVQRLPYAALRERLLAQEEVLDLPTLTNMPPGIEEHDEHRSEEPFLGSCSMTNKPS